MGWKDLPNWLKGGIIGIIVFLVIYLFFILLAEFLERTLARESLFIIAFLNNSSNLNPYC